MSMDRIIERKKRPYWHWGIFSAIFVLFTWMVFQILTNASLRTYRVPAGQITISEAIIGLFEDQIPIRGSVQPFSSVFLDAVGGGVVEEIFVEEGVFVEEGQPLLQFSNTDLQLRASDSDTRITEQINNLNNLINGFETTKINTEKNIIDTEYRILTLERLEKRQRALVTDYLIRQDEYDSTIDELNYQRKVLENIRARQVLEEKIRQDRISQIEVQMQKLEENLVVSQRSYENLLVRAPISGQLTTFNVEIGENKTQGERLGQIDAIEQYKIVALIDEYYVSRVTIGQTAKVSVSGRLFEASVAKVYPEITDGVFEIDLVFAGQVPNTIRRGQSLQIDLTLGDAEQSLLLPVGGFLQDTGGNWVFLLDESGQYAQRHTINVGRRNSRYLEIQDGLESGDRIITSSYNQMADMDQIRLE